ncbi:MAG: hypothetical protein WA144_15550 [Candidatus Methanoperedens sp.]
MKANTMIMMVFVLAVVLLSGCIETLKNGRHSGQVTAIEQSGLIWKTWDVYVKSDISSSQEDRYCVEDVSLIPQLDALSKSRTKVTVLYRGEFYVAPWRCNGLEIITGVEEK